MRPAKKISRFFFLYLSVFIISVTYSQSNDLGEIDSLNRFIQTHQANVNTAESLVELSEILYVSDIDTVMPLCQKAISIVDDIFNQNKPILVEEKNKLLGIKATALNNIGFVYNNKGNISKALEFFSTALKLRETINDKNGVAESLNNIGAIFRSQGKNDKALEYYQKCLVIAQEINDEYTIAQVLSNIGGVYNQIGDWNKALNFYNRSIIINEQTGNKKGIADLLNNIGTIYNNFDSTQKALEYYYGSLKIREEIDDKDGITISLFTIAQIEFDKNNNDQANKLALKSLELSKELGFPARVMNASGLLYKINLTQGNWKNALEMYELFIQMRDSISSEAIREDALKMQLQYEFDKKELETKANQEKKEAIANAEKKRQLLFFWLIVAIAFALTIIAVLIYQSLRVTKNQKRLIEIQKQKVETQKQLIEAKQTEIIDSISYAKYLQDAILPPQRILKQYLNDSFILYKPKDIVAGDFYWLETINSSENGLDDVDSIPAKNESELIFFAAADCTGHGVPGAMVSVVCSNALNRAVKEFGLIQPNLILNKVRELVIETFEKSDSEIKDGMDISLICLNLKSYELDFSGANNPIYIVNQKNIDKINESNTPNTSQTKENNNEKMISEIPADRMPVAAFEKMDSFTNHKYQLQKGDIIYLMSDGYKDQFGGAENKKFKSKQLKNLLINNSPFSMQYQKEQLENTLTNWMGNNEQVDDIMVVGIKV